MNTYPKIVKWLYALATDDIQTVEGIADFCNMLEALIKRLRKECRIP